MATLKPHTNEGHDLGDTNTKWGTVHSGDLQTETMTASGNVEIQGNLTVTGAKIVATVDTVEAKDPLISLAKDNDGDTFDIGFYGKSVDGSSNAKYHGIVRDADDLGKFKVFKDASAEPGTAVGTHSVATVVADLEVPNGSSLKVPNSAGALVDYITAVTLGTARASKVLTLDDSKNVSGIATLTAQTLSAGNISINGSAISSSTGAPSFADVAITGGSVDGTSVGATTASTGAFTTLTVSGDVDLGNANTDTLTINAKVDSDVIPVGAVDLGAAGAKWAEAHVTTVNAVTLSATGNVDLGTDANNTLTVSALVDSDIVPEADGTRSLGSSSKAWGHVHADNVTAASLSSGNVTVTGGSINGATIATSNITVGTNKTLDVSSGTLTTSTAQNKAILQGLAANADPDLGDNTLTAEQFISDVNTGTAPLTVTSTTKVANLNVDKLDGADWAVPAALGSTTPNAVTASELTVNTTALISGDLTLSGDDGALAFDAASSIKIADNSNVSLVIKEANNAYLTFDTTDTAEKVILHKDLDASGIVITAATFAGQISSLSAHSTTNLNEGSNLYYTDERVDDRVSALLVAGEGVDLTYNDANNSLTIAGEDASADNKGLASFATADFTVTSGAVVIKPLGVSDTQLAGSISNTKLSNSSMTIAGQSVALGGAITAASIASAVDGQAMAITALTDLDAAAAADITLFDTLNDAKTLTLGNSTGIIAVPGKLALAGDMTDDLHLASGKKYQINSTDVLSATTLGSGVIKSSLTSVGNLAGGSIANGFGTISTANNISTTKVIDLASDADAADFSADSATGRLTLGASDGLNLYHHTDSYIVNNTGSLKVDVPTSKDIQFSVNGTKEAHIDADGIDLVTGNSYLINNVSVLSANTLGSAVANSSLTSVGALNSGSITNGFTSINVGAGAISTSGTLTGGITSLEKLTVNNVVVDGSNIGHASDLDLLTLADGLLTVDGEVSITTLDIGGTNVTATAQELNILDGDTTATACTLASADRLIVNDNGTMKQVDLDDFETYFESAIDTLPNLTTAVSLTSVGTIATGTWSADTIAVTKGGTGLGSIASGNVLYASASDTIAAAAPGSTSGVQAYSSVLDTFATAASTISSEIAALVTGEIAVLDGAVKGTAVGEKALVLDSNLDITGINTLSAATLIGTAVVKVNDDNKLEATGLTAEKLVVDSITINDDTISSDGNLILNCTGTGSKIKLNSNDDLELQGTGGDLTVGGDTHFARAIFNTIGEAKTDNHTLADGEHIVLFDLSSAGSDKTITLQASDNSAITNRIIKIKNIGSSNTLTFVSTSQIDGAAAASHAGLTSGQKITLIATSENGWQSI